MNAQLQRVLTALEVHGCNPVKRGEGYSARCPAHDDNNPSLSLSEGQAQPVVMNCFAGCKPEQILAALGLSYYFQESQRGAYRWDSAERIVYENRTEALDASRQIVRDRRVVLPRGGKVVQEFAEHVAADVKQLVEDETTGAQAYRYVKTGVNHYSFAFTYDCIAWSRQRHGAGGSRVGRVRVPAVFGPW